ncbi:hypothetical protein CRM22_006695 [Opisthorchis felineus]|uniref:Uncharacterized protein n=1 Tax=Opisthorchis felineus TaxID=147828 RepID=A0A4S2LJL6_OPIFE|nr:hypothetical protein CRM22_006695 [Opisthorchis felineus]
MSFKIPRVEFPRRQPDERIGSDYSFLPMRSSSQEKWPLERTSSQLTNSSLFSRDEFEDTLSLSQNEDSQLFWSSLRKLWNSDGAENETVDSENNHNNAETEQLQTEIKETLSEIQFILSDLEQDTQSWKCKSNVNGIDDSSELEETQTIISLVKTIQKWVSIQKEQTTRFEQVRFEFDF